MILIFLYEQKHFERKVINQSVIADVRRFCAKNFQVEITHNVPKAGTVKPIEVS